MKSVLLVFFFVFIINSVFPQQTKTDSLQNLLKTDKEDTGKVTHLNALCNEYRIIGQYDSALKNVNIALTLGKKINFPIGMAASYNNLGIMAKEQGNLEEALDYYFKSLKIYEEINDIIGIASVLGNLGSVYRILGDFSKAVECFTKALIINKQSGDRSGISDNYLRIGIVYENQGEYPKALNNYFDALKVYEALNNKPRIALALGNIGIVYAAQNNYPKALEYYFKALKMDEELGNKSGITRHLGNIGIVYEEQSNFSRKHGDSADSNKSVSKALEYYFKALTLSKEIGYKQMQAATLGNIGNVYKDQSEYTFDSFRKTESYNKALQYCFSALKIYEEIGDKRSISINLGSIGSLYSKQKKYDDAEKYLLNALSISDSIGALYFKQSHLQFLSELYNSKGEYKKALEYYRQYSIVKDTLFNEEKEKDITRKEMNYEFEKKESATNAEHEKQTAVAAAESRKQKIIIWLMVALAAAAAAVATIIFRSLRITKRQKYVIEKQKEIVDKQRKTVEEKNIEISHKNKELTDSINYAQRIQSAILTSEQYLNDMFLPQGQTASHFILYKPKDIVAGDFYWAYSTADFGSAQSAEKKRSLSEAETSRSHLAIWVTADCTGHGVPGAFMSMIGNSLLNEIVVEKRIHQPDEILNSLRAGVIRALGQSGGEDKKKDGMDATVCAWDKSTNKLSFAGANNCLWIVSADSAQSDVSVNEIIADSQPVGQHLVMNPFTKKEIQLQKGDTLYTFTDGYCDQFGGPKGKKYKYKPFKELLISIQQKSMPEQKEIINRTIEEWKGNLEQIDDICVFGVRV